MPEGVRACEPATKPPLLSTTQVVRALKSYAGPAPLLDRQVLRPVGRPIGERRVWLRLRRGADRVRQVDSAEMKIVRQGRSARRPAGRWSRRWVMTTTANWAGSWSRPPRRSTWRIQPSWSRGRPAGSQDGFRERFPCLRHPVPSGPQPPQPVDRPVHRLPDNRLCRRIAGPGRSGSAAQQRSWELHSREKPSTEVASSGILSGPVSTCHSQ